VSTTNIYRPGGFSPHIDANAYTHVKNIKHLTVLAAVDDMNSENGGLDVVDGSHRTEIKLGEDRCIDPAWVESQKWTSCGLKPGLDYLQYLVLKSY
jgi:ectoine hydroxylase-related dioxygenase (phytanoyl-CoA dioxygenase family)